MITEDQLDDAWATLEPSGRHRRRIDARVSAWLEAADTPLTAEWLALLRVAPFTALGLAAASAAILAATPLVWLARALS